MSYNGRLSACAVFGITAQKCDKCETAECSVRRALYIVDLRVRSNHLNKVNTYPVDST